MRRLSLLAILMLMFGCASVPHRNLPDYTYSPTASISERQQKFEILKIKETTSNSAQIGNEWYSMRDMEKISWSKIDSKRASREFYRSSKSEFLSYCVPPVTFGVATLAGTVIGVIDSIYVWANGNFRISDSETNRRTTNGAEIGAGIGLLAAGIEYLIFSHYHSKHLNDGTEYFNQDLKKYLNLDVIPTQGGVKAGVSTKF